MATSKSTYQYKHSISINRANFLDMVVRNYDLKKNDLRVCLHLMTHLDSESYKEISKKQIAFDLNTDKADVTKAINNLIKYEIIAKGSSASVNGGLKLLF